MMFELWSLRAKLVTCTVLGLFQVLHLVSAEDPLEHHVLRPDPLGAAYDGRYFRLMS